MYIQTLLSGNDRERVNAMKHMYKLKLRHPSKSPNAAFPVITLCGSTRFKSQFEAVCRDLTCDGYIVITVGLFGHADGEFESGFITPELKRRLDLMHFAKISMSDAIYVINPGGYIGESTKREITYARMYDIPVNFMEKERGPMFSESNGLRDRAFADLRRFIAGEAPEA